MSDMPQVGDIVLVEKFTDESQKKYPCLLVLEQINGMQYEWEVGHAKTLRVQAIDHNIIFAKNIKLKQHKNNVYHGFISPYHVKIVKEARKAPMQCKQSIASAAGQKKEKKLVKSSFDCKLDKEKDKKQAKEVIIHDITQDLLEIAIKKVRNQMRETNEDKEKSGEIDFTEHLWRTLVHMAKQAGVIFKFKSTKRPKSESMRAETSEWGKLWDIELFQKWKVKNGIEKGISVSYITWEFKFKGKLFYHTQIVCDDAIDVDQEDDA